MQQLPGLVSPACPPSAVGAPPRRLVQMHWHTGLLQVIALLGQLAHLLQQELWQCVDGPHPRLAAVIESDATAQRVLARRPLTALHGFGPL